MKLKHRDSQKRFYFEDAVYFITTNTKERYPFFREPIFCDLFVSRLRLCKKIGKFKLYGWVLCYDHFHWEIQPGDEINYSRIMFSIKKQFSHDVNRVMGYVIITPNPVRGNDEKRNLKASKQIKPLKASKQIKPLKASKRLLAFRGFVQHEITLSRLRIKFLQKYPNNHPFPKFQWHKSFHDHYIRDEEDFINHLEYIEYNPIKHGLPKDWPYIYTNPKYKDLLDEYYTPFSQSGLGPFLDAGASVSGVGPASGAVPAEGGGGGGV